MKGRTSELARPFLTALALTGGGAVVAYLLVGMPPLLGAEDAAIGFRYARNLAEGHGVVFNPGGERVEGFTSVLWLLISAVVYRVTGPAALEIVLLLLSLGTTLFTLTAILHTIGDRVGSRDPSFWVGAAWLATLPGFYFWSALSLMDVAIWAAGLAAFGLLLDARFEGRPAGRVWLLGTVVALTLTRPESMLVVPTTAVVGGALYGLSRPVRAAVLEVVAAAVVAVGTLTIFRLVYFGYPLPNTYYTKVSPDVVFRLRSGLQYVWDFVAAHPLGGVGAGVAALVLGTSLVVMARNGFGWSGGTEEPRGPVGALFAALAAIGVASVVYGGGDHYLGHRFLQAYLPLLAVPLALAVGPVLGRVGTGGMRRPVVFLGLAASILAVGALDWRTYGNHGLRRQAFDVGLQGRFVGETLNGVFDGSAPPELGLWMVGGAGYAYTGPVKDLLGLNWIAMGMSPGDRKGIRDHAAFNVDVFWSAPPELMIPEPEAVLMGLYGLRCVGTVLGGAMGGVLTSDEFRARFEPVRLRRGESEPIIAFGRSDWVSSGPRFVEALGWEYCGGPDGD